MCVVAILNANVRDDDTMEKQTKGLAAWIKRINEMELPAMAGVVRELNQITEDQQSHAGQLAECILKDAAITSQVLRVANSVQYNPTAIKITTISRAAVLIGYVEIKTICLSVSVIDSLLGKQPRAHLQQLLAKGFHAAVQAKNLAIHLGSEQREQVFIAALLLHIGEMAFYGVGAEVVDQFEKAILEADSQHEACMDVLGVGFNTISKALAKEWHMGELLTRCLNHRQNAAPTT